MYYLLDMERTIRSGIAHYWKQNNYGYTTSIEEAGKFDQEDAIDIVNHDFNGWTQAIEERLVQQILRG